MGTCDRGEHNSYRSIRINASLMQNSFPVKEGYFGERASKSNNRVRRIFSSDPIKTAKDFFNQLSKGAVVEQLPSENASLKLKATLPDGGIIVYREVSHSDGTPAVEINIDHSSDAGAIKRQKIHFMRRDER